MSARIGRYGWAARMPTKLRRFDRGCRSVGAIWVCLLGGCALAQPQPQPQPQLSVANPVAHSGEQVPEFTADSHLEKMAQIHAPPLAWAPKFWLSRTVGSLHTRHASQFNQHNPGLGFEIPFKTTLVSDARWVAGRFKNSDRTHSNYLGAQLMPWALNPSGSWRAGATVGAIDGYLRVRAGAAFPLVMPVVRYETTAGAVGVGFNLFVIPPIAGIPLTFALQLKVGY